MVKVKTSEFIQLNILITPESMLLHRSEKRPKKLPRSDSLKTYSIAKLSKRSRKLSFTTGENSENSKKSDSSPSKKELNSHNTKSKKRKKNLDNRLEEKGATATKNKHKNLKVIGVKVSKTPKIVLKTPKKSKLRKLKSPSSGTSNVKSTKSRISAKESPLIDNLSI